MHDELKSRSWTRRWRRVLGPVEEDLPGFDPAEVADIDRRLAVVDVSERDRRLVLRLNPLVERHVPARQVKALPSLGAARIRFADGTTVLAKGSTPGDVAVLATVMRFRSISPVACRVRADGTHLLFARPGADDTLSIRVTGLDQPD
ncbi:MAG TPA: hypothetical protein VKV06_10025 [Acidimicrobiales bacterium]|nr:hypothetical protein [Acidimicrobiales bacterium]